MKCPYCGKNISAKIIAKQFASIGGSKSRRVLTSEQARAMAEKSAEKRRKREV